MRSEPVLRGPVIECAADAACPCGSFCDAVEHTCKFACMVPPASQAESCATGTQCDDTGRCVAPGGGPPSLAAVLTADPTADTTIPGGAPRTIQVRLAAFSAAAATAAATTQVRATGKDGVEVSCNASTFGHECVLGSWSFAFDGTRYNAARPVLVRMPAGTPDGTGALQLRIDATASDVIVPLGADPGAQAMDGEYTGLAKMLGAPGGLPVTALVAGNFIVVRDPTRVLAPEGTLVIERNAAVPRAITWLQPAGAGAGAGAIAVGVAPREVSFTPTIGRLVAPVDLIVSPDFGSTVTFDLARKSAATPACAVDGDCGAGNVCPTALHACVPASAWTPPVSSPGNQLDDPRSAQWWSAMTAVLGTGEVATGAANPAFATTGPDLVESLLCTTTTGAGHLGVVPSAHNGGPSHAGDLACVADATGQPNSASGAVGLATAFDRKGAAVSSNLLARCLADLARPVTGAFATNFNVDTGDCVNLARALPALRLLATGELDKRTRITGVNDDRRAVGLFTRIVQQWAQLHGFLASTGLSDREFNDAGTASPAEARQQLRGLLDAIDAGWTALLDRRIAPLVSEVAGRQNEDLASYVPGAADYRLAKAPIVYWTFNGGPNANRDIMRNLALTPNRLPPPDCFISPNEFSFWQWWSCPGFSTRLTASDAKLVNDFKRETVVLNLDQVASLSNGADYVGGMIFASEKLAIYQRFLPNSNIAIFSIAHPYVTDAGARSHERIEFFNVGDLHHDEFQFPFGAGTSLALVRDATTRTYTLYRWDRQRDVAPMVFTATYQHDVAGSLDGIAVGEIILGGGPATCNATRDYWAEGLGPMCDYRSFPGHIDDVAIFDAALSQREFLRFAQARGYDDFGRQVWPTNMTLTDYGTQDIATPLGASLVEAATAELEVALRLASQTNDQAAAACQGGDASAQAEVDAVVARLGRLLRRSVVIEALSINDTSAVADTGRALFGVKRSELARGIHRLSTCQNLYGVSDDEVPLYFDGVSPLIDEKAAFFAASDHLIGLAEQRAQAARTALETLRNDWDRERQSQIQQLQDDTNRAIRLDELAGKYGEQLRRLCGIADQTPAQIIAGLRAGTLSVDNCFVMPSPTSCRAVNFNTPIMDADPACYRGAIGAALLDIRTAFFAQQSAYQSWQAAGANAEAAERMCVLKELDVFGCSALDRHALTGVTCPEGHQGTIELVADFNAAADVHDHDKSIFDSVTKVIGAAAAIAGAVAATVATGGAAAGPAILLLGAGGIFAASEPLIVESIEGRKRQLDAMIQKRALIDDIRTCWNTAGQYERTITAAGQSFAEAMSRAQSAALAFQNNLAEARAVALEAPIVLDREEHRPAIPIAFHYWLPDALENYKVLFDAARRYSYVALRATEYDMLDSYAIAQAGKPSRAAVLGAWNPNALLQQLQRMRDQTNTRKVANGKPPSLQHMTFDLGAKFFGLPESAPGFGQTLNGYVRPVYSLRGEYLGLGVRFSLVPDKSDEAPTWRCAERIWRVNVGATGFPTTGDGTHVKLLKRNVFASRRCDGDGFQRASLRPTTNLLVTGGDPQTYTPEVANSVADVRLMDFSIPDALQNFKFRDDFLNGSSSELALEGMYGDYVLLFSSSSLAAGLQLDQLHDFFLRFDFLSVDNTPPSQLRAARPARVELDAHPSPIIVE